MYTASTIANLPPRSGSGISSSGGNWRMRPTEVTSSGTVAVHSSHACSTSDDRSHGKKRTPA